MIEKILNKVDALLEKRNYLEAEKVIKYWLEEMGDRDKLTLLNELLGLYRKTGREELALSTAVKTEELLNTLQLQTTENGAITYINIATVYSAFKQYNKALSFYKKSEALLNDNADKALLSSLYNNMGTCYSMLNAPSLAILYLKLAISLSPKPLDKAITHLNLADIYLHHLKDGEKEREEMQKAKEIFLTEKHDSYFAFVADKCAPGFKAHGDEEFSTFLEKLRDGIYEGT